MKPKTVVIILILVCLGLGAALVYVLYTGKEEKEIIIERSKVISNNWETTSKAKAALEIKSSDLETSLETRIKELEAKSNQVVNLNNKLAKADADAKAAEKRAKDELAKRDTKISELEGQRDDLTKRMTELNSSIDNLEKQITDTEKKLASAEGDREFLLKELKRLQTEKADLERQLNDLAFLRNKVKQMRDELSIARQLEWIRRGLGLYSSSKKEAAKVAVSPEAAKGTNFNLNVELNQDGSVKVNAPATNAPAGQTNAPPKK